METIKSESDSIRNKIGMLELELETSRKYRVRVEKILKQATDALVIALSVKIKHIYLVYNLEILI